MATTQNTYTGNGSTTSYSITFQYLNEDDIKVSLDGVVTTAYSLSNATTVLFDTAPASDVLIRIYRETDVDSLKTTFFAGSSIRAQDLNRNFEQNNYRTQELTNNTWDKELETIHSDETWVSSDAQIATTAAMDARFQDEVNDTLTKAELSALSDVIPDNDDAVPTTGAVKDYVDHVIETDILVDGTGLNKTGSSGQVTIGISAGSVDLDRIKPADIVDSTETWSATNTQIATTQAIEDRIDEIITNDIGTDGTGITVTDDGDGTITLGLANNSIDLARIKNADIITSGETDPDNDTTIATTAKIGDMIDTAIANDITSDGSGVTVTDDGDGTITLSVAEGALNLNRINAGNIVTESEQDAGITEADTTIFTTLAAAKRFDTLVQTASPSGSAWEVGKTWLQNDDDLTLSIWNGTGWTAVSSGGTFTEQPSVVYVDQASGDDNNTGHRISTPKATIKAAIEQINAEIDTEITAGGSGYGEGSYTTVSLTGGTGSGLTANITVNASGAVSAVTINDTDVLEDYSIGDVLSAADADLGNTGLGTGFQLTVTGDGDGQIVVVSAGTYQEVAPIQIKRRNVSVIGQALRSCIVHPTSATELNTLFELNSGSYIANLTLTGMQAGTGTGNTLDAVLPTDQGWNFAFYEDAFITKSPYIQNCTNFSDSEIDNDDLRSHRPRGGQAGDTDSAPTGGGLLVNGATPHADSPLRSMVADSYTHVALNGPGILVTNNGYTQITSSYAFFNTYHIKCLNGGQANLAASTTDFGDRSLVADGRSTSAIFTSNVDGAANDGATSFNVNQPTAGTGWFGDTQRPAGNMLVEVNSVTYPILSATPNTDSEGGDGWTVTISRPDPDNRSNNLGLNGAITDDAAVSFFLRSMIASSGHTMEYVGSGTNYSALPENGGVPNEARQITESNNGKVWTAITDHNGKFRIGGNQTDDPIFEVDQQLGFVTIPEGSIAFNLLSDETPQLGGNLDVQARTITTSTTDGNITLDPNGTGVVDVSTSRIVNVTDPTGNQDAATKAYVDTEVGAIGTPSSISTLNTSVATSDTGTNGTITFTTDGTTAMTVNNNQRVGIGATNPEELLHLSSASPKIKLTDTTTGADHFLDGDSGVGTFWVKVDDNAEGSNPAFIVDVGGTERARIDSSGRVGIGTSSPAERLHLSGTSSWVRLDATATGGGNFMLGSSEIGGSRAFSIYDVSGSAYRLSIDSSGRVGIGTTSPTARLDVRRGDTDGLIAELHQSGGYGIDIGSSESVAYISSGYLQSLAFKTDPSSGQVERARIDSSGRLLVGTSTSTSVGGFGEAKIQTKGDYTSSVTVINNENNANVSGFIVGKVRSTSIVQSGDPLGGFYFQGYDGSSYEIGASITASVDGTPGTNDMPSRIMFNTCADGAASATERLRIASTGAFGIAGANYGSSGQVLTSQGSGSAPQWASPSAVIVKGSAVAFNGSTDVEFTGIGSTVCRIIFAVDKISANGNDRFTLELGHSGGYTTSGYIAWAKTIGGSALATGSQLTSAFDLTANGSASESFSGVIELLNGSGNSWVLNSNLQGSADNRKIAGGRVVVGGTLTKIKFDVGGSTFDDGHVRMYTFTEA